MRDAVMDTPPRPDGQLTPSQLRNRKLRNRAIGLAVAFLAVLFYVITIVKVGPGVFRAEP
jgi:hypothetical protein